MRKVMIYLLKLEVLKVDPKETVVDIKISYNSNSEVKNALIRTRLNNVEEAALKVLKYIKNKERVFVGGDNILDSISIVNINDEERVEEKLGHFFGKVLDRISEVKSKKNSEGYLNLYSGLSGQKIEFSKSI